MRDIGVERKCSCVGVCMDASSRLLEDEDDGDGDDDCHHSAWSTLISKDCVGQRSSGRLESRALSSS